MGRDTQRVTQAHLERYLEARGFEGARISAMLPLGAEEQTALKDYGYGRPLRITFEASGVVYNVVLRTMGPDPFGHERRADRIASFLLAYDTFNTIPRHIDAIDVGGFTSDGVLVPMPVGEPYLLTDYVDGRLYADELHSIAGLDRAPEESIARARALARYLVDLHSVRAPAEQYVRSVRDAVGSGEGIFGLCDSYPADHPVATPDRLCAIEHAAVDWRWRLRGQAHRCRRTHGDFHPFNLLFREGTDLSVLDCSRGAAGEPADDLTCLSINYLFFALTARGRFDGACRALWDAFWSTWSAATDDPGALDVVAPFFAWRGLVVASPVWYPRIDDAVRATILRFVEGLLGGARFRPDEIDGVHA